MKFAIKTWLGYVSLRDTGKIGFAPAVGAWETFYMEDLDPQPIPPEPIPPPSEDLPLYAGWTGSDKDWFFSVWEKKNPELNSWPQTDEGFKSAQDKLSSLETFLNQNNWLLTPPNAEGSRTKIRSPRDMHWYRVIPGEGHLVWLDQGLG